MNVSRSSTKVFLASVGTTVVGFLGVVYFARILGSERLGVYFLFQALVMMIVVVSDFGIETAVEKRMSGAAPPDETLSSALALYAVAFGAVAVAVALFAGRIDEYVGARVAPLLVFVVVVTQLKRLVIAALNGELRVGETAILRLADKVIWAAAGAALVLAGLGVRGLIYGVAAGATVSLVWGAWKLDTSLARPSLTRVRSLVGFAKYNFVPSLGLQVHSWMDVLIIGFFLSQSAVGAYEVAWQLAGATTLLAASIGTAMLPQASAWDTGAESDRIGRLLSAAITPSLFLIVPAFFGAVVLAPELLGVLFGAEFTVASVALLVLIAGKVPEAIQMLVGKVLLGMDKPELVARATVYTIVLNLALNVALISEFGLVGAAIGTTASFTVGLLFRVKYLLPYVDVRIPYRELGWCLLASVGMYALLTLVTNRMVVDSLPRLFAVIGLGAAAYFAIVLLSESLRARAFEYKRSLISE